MLSSLLHLLRCIASSIRGLALIGMAVMSVARAQAPDNDCNQGMARPPRVDPRQGWVICLPEVGRMTGTIDTTLRGGYAEEFGREIVPLGDIDHDGIADIAISHQRVDTLVDKFPVDVLIYKGERGHIPDVGSGRRLGPIEIGSRTRVLAADDWDGDGNIDLATEIWLYGDTSGGNSPDYYIKRLVVFWGNSRGEYSISDTSRLCDVDVSDIWGSVTRIISSDFNDDGVPDLLAWGGGSWAKEIDDTPRLHLFLGRSGVRWGAGRPRLPDWTMWTPPKMNYMSLIDQDCDGRPDLVLSHMTGSTETGTISILYGTGSMPDTTQLQTISLANANGISSEFLDVTGDGVPELIATCDYDNVIKIWAGRAGMRIKEQYGSGFDEPRTDTWVSRPWRTIWDPKRINHDWDGSGFWLLYDLGDLNLDGYNEIVTRSYPFFICYSTGDYLDSLIDGMIFPQPKANTAVKIGNFDGSGRQLIASWCDTGHDGGNPFPGMVLFMAPSKEVPRLGEYHPISPLLKVKCSNTAAVPEDTASVAASSASVTLTATPNPSTGRVEISWHGGASAGVKALSISDASGRQVRRIEIGEGATSYSLEATGWPRGTYFLTLFRDGRSAAETRILLR